MKWVSNLLAKPIQSIRDADIKDKLIFQIGADLCIARAEVQRLQRESESRRLELLRLKDNEQRLLHRALHDEVTALPNRRFFRQRLDAALLSATDLAVFYIDLDSFKALNDSYGHHTGDHVLRIVAQRMSDALRTHDVVSRFGGDEFTCLLAGVPTFDHLAQMARKLLKAAATPVQLKTGQFSVRLSIGIARFPVDGRTTDALLQSADLAMYQAKRQKTGYAFSKPQIGPVAAAYQS
jgi:diguanylate cyclase